MIKEFKEKLKKLNEREFETPYYFALWQSIISIVFGFFLLSAVKEVPNMVGKFLPDYYMQIIFFILGMALICFPILVLKRYDEGLRRKCDCDKK